MSLVDALGKNKSLTRLDLSLARLEWMPPLQREQRSALPLLRLMNANPKALEALERLIISSPASRQPTEGLFSGFAALYSSLPAIGSTQTEGDLKKLFDEIDEDGSGTLEVEELQKVFQTKLGIRKTDEEIQKVFEEIKGARCGCQHGAMLPTHRYVCGRCLLILHARPPSLFPAHPQAWAPTWTPWTSMTFASLSSTSRRARGTGQRR